MLKEKAQREAKITKIAYAIANEHRAFIDQILLDVSITPDDYEAALRKAIKIDQKFIPRSFSGKYIGNFIANALLERNEFYGVKELYDALTRNDYSFLVELINLNLVPPSAMLSAAIKRKDYNLWDLICLYQTKRFWLTETSIFEQIAVEIMKIVDFLSLEPLYIFGEEVEEDTTDLKALTLMLKDMVSEGADTEVEVLHENFKLKEFVILGKWLEEQTEKREKFEEIDKIIKLISKA